MSLPNNLSSSSSSSLPKGQGCPADPSQAAELFTRLSMKGHPYAQFALAGMYYVGSGVEQNFKRAFSLYKVALCQTSWGYG